MEKTVALINGLMIDVFNDILRIEEETLRKGPFSDTSVTEVHTIEAIGMYEKKTASEVAKKLNITAGTLTVAVNNLVKKGYALRLRDEDDRRLVKLGLTKKGRLLYRVHERFHVQMVRASLTGLTKEAEETLVKAFYGLHAFLSGFYQPDAQEKQPKGTV